MTRDAAPSLVAASIEVNAPSATSTSPASTKMTVAVRNLVRANEVPTIANTKTAHSR
jgi:hypothetical protein